MIEWEGKVIESTSPEEAGQEVVRFLSERHLTTDRFTIQTLLSDSGKYISIIYFRVDKLSD